MNQKSQIAIIISTYNRMDLIKETLDACLQQSVPPPWNFQVILVDDGSTDNTIDTLVREYCLHQKENHWHRDKIWILPQENRERGAARNHGAFFAINHLHPRWLFFLDSDDLLTENSLENLISRLSGIQDSENVVAIYANCIHWLGEKRFGPLKFNRPPAEGKIPWSVLTKPSLAIGTTLISAQAFEKAKGFNESRDMSGSEDWDLWFRLSLLGNIYYSDHISIWYRRHPQSTLSKDYEKSILEAVKSIEKTITESWPQEQKKAIQKVRTYGYFMLAGSFNSENQSQKALHYLGKSLQENWALLFQWRWWRYLASILSRSFRKSSHWKSPAHQ